MKRKILKTYKVWFRCCHESYNGYDHYANYEYLVEAKNESSAMNKSRKLLPFYEYVCNASVNLHIPDPVEEICNKAVKRVKRMNKKQRLQLMKDSGVFTKSGKLSKRYR